MQKINLWFYSVFPNLLFFGAFGFFIVKEAATYINAKISGDAFLYILPIYIIFFAIFSYNSTRKILLPCASFGISIFAFLMITDYYTAAFSGLYDYSGSIWKGVILIFLIFSIVPTVALLLIQLLVKFIYKKLKK